MPRYQSSLKKTEGFTLPELLASLAIIGLILVTVIYNHRQFDSDIELTNVAYRVALVIRQAQVYGVSVRQYGPTQGFGVPYGVQFYLGGGESETQQDQSGPTSFVFFGDADKDGYYDSGEGCNGECIERINLTRGNYISKFCVVQDNNGRIECIPASSGRYSAIKSLDITFVRPKSDSVIRVHNDGGQTPGGIPALRGALVCLSSPTGKLRKVSVYNTGQISVENVAPGDGCLPSSEEEEG